jgi:hypothetical protein
MYGAGMPSRQIGWATMELSLPTREVIESATSKALSVAGDWAKLSDKAMREGL